MAGLDVQVVRDLGVEGLPDPEEGTYYLVISRVALAAPDRADLLVPSDVREWGDGRQVVGALLRPEPTPRGWGQGLPDLSEVVVTLGNHGAPWATQVVAERTRDGSWVVHSNGSPSPIGDDGSLSHHTSLDKATALAKLVDLLPAAQQWGRTYEEKLKNLL